MGNTLNTLTSLRNHNKHSHLLISPNELDLLSIILCIGLFIVRTIKHSLGFGTPFVPSKNQSKVSGRGDVQDGQLFMLPDISLSMPLRLTTYHSQVFAKAVGAGEHGFTDLMSNDAQLCLYLAALSEPAMLLLLAKRGCPIRPLGAVNVRNRFELLEPQLCRAIFGHSADSAQTLSEEDSVVHSNLSVISRFSRPARTVRKGIEIDIEVSIMIDHSENDRVQARPTAIFRQDFTMLQFVKSSSRGATTDSKAPDRGETQHVSKDTEPHEGRFFNSIVIPTVAPYAWGELCKDYNPIHFSSVLAKLLGQSGQLAHGNHAVGICIESMSRAVNQATAAGKTYLHSGEVQAARHSILTKMRSDVSRSGIWWMEIRFRRPIVLPASIDPRIYEPNDVFDILDSRTGKVGVEVSFGLQPS